MNGSLGETSALALIAGGIYLCVRRVASWEIPAGTLLAAFKLADGFDAGDSVDVTVYFDGAAVITRTTISYDEEGLQTKTRETYRMTVTESGGETDGEPVLVHSFTFQEITDPGYDPDHPDAVYTKITRDDGRCVIVRQKAEPANGIPRVSDHYDASGVLRATVSELRDRRTGVTSITRTTYVYDDGGNLVATHVHTGSMSYEFGDNSVTVTRQWDSGRRVVVTIEELSDGYRVTRDTPRGTIIYIVKFTDSGSVELYNENGVLIATVIVDDDGAWLVTYAGGETENGQRPELSGAAANPSSDRRPTSTNPGVFPPPKRRRRFPKTPVSSLKVLIFLGKWRLKSIPENQLSSYTLVKPFMAKQIKASRK